MSEVLTPPELDLESLRLPQNFGENLGVRKIHVRVPVQKPAPDRFFRVHPSPANEFPGLIYEEKTAREIYLIAPGLADFFGRLARPVVLHLAVDRRGNPFLIPLPLPGPTGARNPWHESLAKAIEIAKEEWVRVMANLANGVYDVFVAEADLPPPEWPAESMEKLVQTAFNGKVINSEQHPVVQGLAKGI